MSFRQIVCTGASVVGAFCLSVASAQVRPGTPSKIVTGTVESVSGNQVYVRGELQLHEITVNANTEVWKGKLFHDLSPVETGDDISVRCSPDAPGKCVADVIRLSEKLDSDEKDVYAIYSLMLSNPQTSHGPDDNERYLIAASTAPTRPLVPCVRPPKERESDFQQVRADYERRKAIPRQLKVAISISKPYELLTPDDAGEFVQSGMAIPGHNVPNERFKGVNDLFTLSDVYFDQRRTLALTGISTFCGSACGLFQWKVFEKSESGKWEERQWITCGGIAENVRPFAIPLLEPANRPLGR